ncbi:MAG: HipA N-terminal domain-containing protein [Alphaproteobacteria bacterium]|jgi:serine/threonine-protein kinase HipA|nr:HipA N-terminal domain-containing protein [Alphaproteobacteria bacterium]
MTQRALVFFQKAHCGILEEVTRGRLYRFTYDADYKGPMISLTLPVRHEAYIWDVFPPFFDGLLPEGMQLEALLRTHKIDHNDFMKQLLAVGEDLVGAVSVRPAP